MSRARHRHAPRRDPDEALTEPGSLPRSWLRCQTAASPSESPGFDSLGRATIRRMSDRFRHSASPCPVALPPIWLFRQWTVRFAGGIASGSSSPSRIPSSASPEHQRRGLDQTPSRQSSSSKTKQERKNDAEGDDTGSDEREGERGIEET